MPVVRYFHEAREHEEATDHAVREPRESVTGTLLRARQRYARILRDAAIVSSVQSRPPSVG